MTLTEWTEDGRKHSIEETHGNLYLRVGELPLISLPRNAAVLTRLSNEDIMRLRLPIPCRESLGPGLPPGPIPPKPDEQGRYSYTDLDQFIRDGGDIEVLRRQETRSR